jgi:hypothetical protein
LRLSVLIAAEIPMAHSATGADRRCSRIGEAEDFGGIAIAIDVGFAGSVTRFTALLLRLDFRKQLLMGGV